MGLYINANNVVWTDNDTLEFEGSLAYDDTAVIESVIATGNPVTSYNGCFNILLVEFFSTLSRIHGMQNVCNPNIC